jgi:hypothetical protein
MHTPQNLLLIDNSWQCDVSTMSTTAVTSSTTVYVRSESAAFKSVTVLLLPAASFLEAC